MRKVAYVPWPEWTQYVLEHTHTYTHKFCITLFPMSKRWLHNVSNSVPSQGDRGGLCNQCQNGLKGEKGIAGQDGLPGLAGERGYDGPKGNKGEAGYDGLPGLMGEKGDAVCAVGLYKVHEISMIIMHYWKSVCTCICKMQALRSQQLISWHLWKIQQKLMYFIYRKNQVIEYTKSTFKK